MEDALERLGGVGGFGEITALSSRWKLRQAVRQGRVVHVARGRYVLANLDRDRRTAARLAAITSHAGAAVHWGWKVKWVPDQPWVTVPRKRSVDPDTHAVVQIVYADLKGDDVRSGVTSPLRTVIDCARRLPFDEALAIADSALREGDVTRDEMIVAAARVRGRGAGQCRRVAAEATPEAANPFESVLRALVLEFSELDMVPQLPVTARGQTWHPDLVDESRRIVIEADSWEFHTDKRSHARDCVRYTALAMAGWLVVRFTWEQVMHSPGYVRSVLTELAARPQGAPSGRRSAA